MTLTLADTRPLDANQRALSGNSPSSVDPVHRIDASATVGQENSADIGVNLPDTYWTGHAAVEDGQIKFGDPLPTLGFGEGVAIGSGVTHYFGKPQSSGGYK